MIQPCEVTQLLTIFAHAYADAVSNRARAEALDLTKQIIPNIKERAELAVSERETARARTRTYHGAKRGGAR